VRNVGFLAFTSGELSGLGGMIGLPRALAATQLMREL
jgi:hypothetical protein